MKARIYIVEDHPVMRDMVARVVSHMPNAEVCGTAGSAEQALMQLPVVSADLALVDVSLPSMSGIDLLRELKQRWPQMRCLMVSAHHESVYAKHALALGAEGYVPKGDTDRLVQAISGALCADGAV